MSMNTIVRNSVVALMLPAAFAAFGKEIVWTGSANTTWDKATQNWKEASGDAACAFADGDDVTIGNATTAVTLGANVKPGSVLIDISGPLALGFSGECKFLSGIGSFVKDGAGTLTVTASGGKQAFRDFNGDVTIRSGALVFSGANQYASLGGLDTGTFFVEAGATMQVLNRNCFGKVDDINGCKASVVVRKGGTLKFGPDGTSHTGNTVKDLTLDGGSFEFAGAGVGPKQGTLTVLGRLTVTGDVAQVMTDTTANDNNRVGLAWQKDSAGSATSAARTVFDVADVTGDDRPDLTFEKPLTRGPNVNNVAGLVKTGAGRMRLAYDGDANSGGGYYGRQLGPNGDVDVLGGVLEFAGAWTVPVPNAANVPHRYYIGTNATLHVSNPNCVTTDVFTVDDPNVRTKMHVDHGTFLIDCPGFKTGHVFLPDELVLEDAVFQTTLDGFADDNYALGALTLGSLLHIKGTKAFELMPFEGMKNNRLALLDTKPTEIRVDDVTGDDAVDATIGFKLCDRRYVRPGGTATRASGFVKTGAGTLLLTPTTTTLSMFSGDTEIREGIVRLDKANYDSKSFGTASYSFLGDVKNTNLNSDRKIIVSTNGVLEFCQRNMLDSYTYGETGGNEITTEVVLRGGKIRFVGDNSANIFGDITVDGGSFEYGEAKGNKWGVMNFRGTFKVTGEKPLTLPTCDIPRFTLYPSYACVFDIDDVTKSAEPDFVSWQIPAKPTDPKYYNGTPVDSKGTCYTFTYGFIKRGAGTMVLEQSFGNDTDFDAEARVEAGALVLNADFSKAGGTAVVSSGAAIGGTGKIAGATLAEGAGFVGTAGQRQPLEIGGDLALPATGFVDIRVPEGVDHETAKARVMTVTGNLTGAQDLSGWTVTVNGKSESGLQLFKSGKTLMAGHLSGFMLIVR